MELLRRLILSIFICSSVFLAKLADISPVILIEIVDFAELGLDTEFCFVLTQIQTPFSNII